MGQNALITEKRRILASRTDSPAGLAANGGGRGLIPLHRSLQRTDDQAQRSEIRGMSANSIVYSLE
jgi:hypothetical protein